MNDRIMGRKNVNSKNIFWSGGFDSTFRILELIDDRSVESIQPIYFASDIDHEDKNAIIGKRKSREKEIETIMKIKEIINSRKINEPIIMRDEPKYSFLLRITMRYLAYKRMVRRPVCQIGAMAEYSLHNNIRSEVAIIETDFMRKTFDPYLIKQNETYVLPRDLAKKRPTLWIFQNLEFPLIKKSKVSIIETAIKKNWLPILKETWSCWYPYKNGTPCLRCPMCKNRII